MLDAIIAAMARASRSLAAIASIALWRLPLLDQAESAAAALIRFHAKNLFPRADNGENAQEF
jgi:hypothetical protein